MLTVMLFYAYLAVMLTGGAISIIRRRRSRPYHPSQED